MNEKYEEDESRSEGRSAPFAEASILGSKLMEGMNSRPPTPVIFSSLPILLSRNRSKAASFINFPEESAQPQELLLDKLRTQFTWITYAIFRTTQGDTMWVGFPEGTGLELSCE